MKTMIFAAALLCGSAAIAQDATMNPGEPEIAVPTTSVSDSAATPAPMPAAEQSVAPGNTAPERDARGIPVISDPASAPSGFNQAPGMNGMGGPLVDASQPPAQQPSDASYPACSRTVTDNCVQTYERGRARSPR